MLQGPLQLSRRTVGEWQITSPTHYDNPFVDVILDAIFSGPDGQTMTVPAYYDGGSTWRFRANLPVAGTWSIQTTCRPIDAELTASTSTVVLANECRGYVQSCPGEAWGFKYESGEPIFFLGDTVYNLFGMQHCGGNVANFLTRRAEQGHNLLRIRVPVSPFHPPRGYSDWQNRRTWPWGGSEQTPLLDRFNLDYFASVDQVVAQCEALDLGIEMIMEAWGFEYPFNHRELFVPEMEDLWMRYLIARYDAYNCIAIWTLMNEYEYYPDGDWRYNPVADLWALRRARWHKAVAPHGHVVAIHNGPRQPAFAERFKLDPEAIDTVMFQDWGTCDKERGWLAAGIEDQIRSSLQGWIGSAVFSEWGYERNPEFDLKIPGHEFCCVEHSRRGAWRGAMCAYGIIAGWENSWGPWMKLDEDQPGLQDVLLVTKFFTEVVDFANLRPADDLVYAEPWDQGEAPLCLASEDESQIVVYLPTGGFVGLTVRAGATCQWLNPRTGELTQAVYEHGSFDAPQTTQNGHPCDWALVVKQQ